MGSESLFSARNGANETTVSDNDPCQRCGSDEWEYVDYGGCSKCRPYEERAADGQVSLSGKCVRSNMGLVHAVAPSGVRAVCGAALRESWGVVEVADWAREPNVCRSCDDVLMSRGRKAAS